MDAHTQLLVLNHKKTLYLNFLTPIIILLFGGAIFLYLGAYLVIIPIPFKNAWVEVALIMTISIVTDLIFSISRMFNCVGNIFAKFYIIIHAVIYALVICMTVQSAISVYKFLGLIHGGTTFSSLIRTSMNESMKEYDKTTAFEFAWDKLQNDFKCCGIDQKEDWISITKRSKFPKSCCITGSECSEPKVKYDMGCFKDLFQYVFLCSELNLFATLSIITISRFVVSVNCKKPPNRTDVAV